MIKNAVMEESDKSDINDRNQTTLHVIEYHCFEGYYFSDGSTRKSVPCHFRHDDLHQAWGYSAPYWDISDHCSALHEKIVKKAGKHQIHILGNKILP